MSNNEEKKDERSSKLMRGSTFASQATIPRLPIPTLEETLERFPRAVQALQDAAERKATKKVTEEFLHGDGPKLQKMLRDYEEEGRSTGRIGSYVEEFWSEAYLAPNASVVMNLNPFFLLEDGPDAKLAKDQIGRSASLIFASVKLASLLKHESLAPDLFKGKPLCMDQFKALFGSCRVPRQNDTDYVEVDPTSTHVVVMCRNQFYYFNALWPDGTVAVDESDLKEILTAIKEDSIEIDPEISVKSALGVLTTLPRKAWALARDNLIASSSHNSAALEILDSALFVFVLDDVVPNDVHEAAANILHGSYKVESKCGLQYFQCGSCCNRWYDKLQIIVCGDGSAGVNFEHSAIDGHTALRFASDIFAETVVSFAQSITKSIHGAGSIPNVISAEVKRAAILPANTGAPLWDTSPKKLEFELPESVTDKIFFAETALGDEIMSSDTYVLEFKTYGKSFIVKNKMSPDSFVQMSMLLAYYLLYGKVVCQYEPVMTKHFFHGRTEAMRTATPVAAGFCETWASRFSSKEAKLAALRDATKEHSRLVREASSGKGVDRHLFALKCIAEKNGVAIPPFFESEAWKALNHTVLSTSNCGNPALRLFGFGPVVPDGFGIGYIIKDDGLQYSISSKHRQTKRFAHTLHKVLLDFKEIMQPLSSVRVESATDAEVTKIIEKKESLLEYADGIDYFGELDIDEKVPTPSTELGARNYVGVVKRREMMVSQELRQSFDASVRKLSISNHD